jgi:PAS domain S-box-containing protein
MSERHRDKAEGLGEGLARTVLEALDRSGIGVAVTDPEDRFIYSNEVHARSYGCRPEELVGKTWRDLVPPETHASAEAAVNECFPQGRVLHLDIPALRQDKAVGWDRVAAVPQFDAEGRYAGHVGIVQDITEQRRAEEALRESEERYRELVEGSEDIVWGLDELGRFTYLNPAVKPLLGMAPGDLLGHHFLEIASPADKGRFLALFERLLAGHAISQEELFFLKRSGETVCFSVSGRPVYAPDGRLVGIRGTARDVTERRQAEEALRKSEARYRAVVEDQTEFVCRIQPGNWERTFINEAYSRFLGKPREELIGRSFMPLVAPEDRERLTAAITSLTPENPVEVFEYRVTLPSGEVRRLRWTYRALFGEQGHVVEYQAVGRDITERKLAEEALRATQERLEHVISVTPAALFTCEVTPPYRVTFISDHIRAMLGYEPREALEDPTFWVDRLHPEDALAMLTGNTPLFEKGRHSQEYRFRAKDGTWRWMFNEMRLVRDADGEPAEVVGYWADITERRQAEQALRESEERFRSAYDHASIGMTLTGLDGRLLSVNRAFAEITGYSDEELLQKDYLSITHPDDAEASLACVRRLLEGETRNFTMEKRYVHKSGSIIWVRLNASVVNGVDGKPVHLIAQVEDITDRKRAEGRLRESEERYRSLFTANHSVMLLVEPGTGRIIDANPAACHFYGYSREELTSKGIDEINTLSREEVFREMQAARAERRSFFSFRHRLAGGELRDVEVHSGPIQVEGRQVLYSVIHDVTEQRLAEEALRESERKYRELIENAHEGVWLLDAEGGTAFANARMAEILGYSQYEMLGQPLASFLDKWSLEPWERLAEPSPHDAKERHSLEFRRRDGSLVYTSLSLSPIIDGSGGRVGSMALVADETAQRRAYEQLRRGEKLSALGQMAAGVAHDFNNSLTTILSLAQSLLLETPGGGVRDSLALIEQAARDAAQVVRRLQEFAGARRGEADFGVCDVNQIIEEALKLTRPRWKNQAQAQGRTIEVSTALRPVPGVWGNASELREVLTNLIFNAVDAMPQGGRLVITSSLRPGGTVEVRVRDTGEGMSHEVARQVFDPFFTTKGPANSGLGLSMAYGILTRHKGSIRAHGSPGHGALFLLTLPVATGAECQPPAAAGEARGEQRGVRILMVDDDPRVLASSTELLTSLGHEVVCAGDAEEAIRLFKPHLFDLVITDLGMPGISGWGVAAHVASVAPEVPVGLVTGWSESVEPELARRMGVRFVLAKPFGHEELAECIRQVCPGVAASS